MPDFAAPVERLIDQLKHLPGIGQKTAQRLAFHLLRSSPENALALADAIRDAKEKIRECSTCHNITDTDPCLYCVGPTRNHRTICVVEEAHNIMAIEKTRMYSGMYHVLGGALSPLSGRGPEQLKIKSLIERLKGGGMAFAAGVLSIDGSNKEPKNKGQEGFHFRTKGRQVFENLVSQK